MAYQEFLPDPRLRGLVHAYWQVEEFHDVGQQEHMMMPERLVSLNFYAGTSFQAHLGAALDPMPGAVLSDLTLTPKRVVSLGLTRVLGAELYPWGARQLLGWSMAARHDPDLSHQYPQVCHDISGLLGLNDWAGARQRLEAWLLSLWQARAQDTGKGVQAAAQLYLSLGNARIGEVAEELNLSPRQLERQFAQQVGVNAKTLARLIRFEEIHNRLWWHPGQSLSALAYDLGFADQAHLTREFRSLSLMSPRAFAEITQRRRPLEPVRDHIAAPAPELQVLAGTLSPLDSVWATPALQVLAANLSPAYPGTARLTAHGSPDALA